VNRAWYWWFFFSYSKVEGKARCRPADGRCYVNLTPDQSEENLNKDPNFNILFVEYNEYAVIYSCREAWFGWAMQEELWLISRTTTLPDAKLSEIRANIKSRVGYDSEKFSILGNGNKENETCVYE
jgi:lipocalin